ncbi:helix-turn-helix domain-containing protein [Exiguobacterium flavidum]|uniref:helix-turn-helix domain-containing protein n=1 Tax=Exiguobacterium flavidum TaxID=2184695 RepID=UPI000DF7785C|nr:helix-turn-helix transcriptional regulator [Exiguobacterium flavidum]
MSQELVPIAMYGERIRRLRERQGMDAVKLAELTDSTPQMIERIERSLAHPSLSMIERLAEALAVPTDHLLRHIWPAEAIRRMTGGVQDATPS